MPETNVFIILLKCQRNIWISFRANGWWRLQIRVGSIWRSSTIYCECNKHLLNLQKKIDTYYSVLGYFNWLYITITQQVNNDILKVPITIQKCCSMEELLDESHRCVPPAGDKFHKKKIEMILKHRYRQALSHRFIGSSSNGNYNIISLLF